MRGAACAILAAACANAFAAGPDDKAGWYGGLDVGRSHLNMQGSDLDAVFAGQGITTGGSSLDRHATTWGLNLGYRFNKYFGLEGDYIDLGKYSYNSPATAPGADVIQGRYKAHAWALEPVGFLPLTHEWDLFGKVGLTSTDANLSATSTTGATAPSGGSHSNAGWMLGAGTTYDFTRNLYGKLEFDHYSRVGDGGTTGKSNADVIGAGIGVRF